MTDFVIPCDAFVRLTNILHNYTPDDPAMRTVRIDHGVAVATNENIMAMECVGGPVGVIHLIADPALIAQCRTEAAFNSVLTITVNDMLKFAVAKTTMGYVHPGNCAVFPTGEIKLDRWRNIVARCAEPLSDSEVGMFWDTDAISILSSSSPTGRVIFEQYVGYKGRPTIIRDVNDPNWCGVFQPWSAYDGNYPNAVLPDWLK